MLSLDLMPELLRLSRHPSHPSLPPHSSTFMAGNGEGRVGAGQWIERAGEQAGPHTVGERSDDHLQAPPAGGRHAGERRRQRRQAPPLGRADPDGSAVSSPARPSPISAAMMRRVVALIGTARPSPTPATAVFTPTMRARPSTRAPPELPGFNAASVWMTLSTMRAARPLEVGKERPRALTTPAVTDPARPIGLPRATTSWPTRSWSAFPRDTGSRSAALVRITARSESGSRPTTSNGSSRPSVREARPRLAPSTTWAEVTRNPSGVMITAEPAPCAWYPPGTRLLTRRLATDGRTRSATEVT